MCLLLLLPLRGSSPALGWTTLNNLNSKSASVDDIHSFSVQMSALHNHQTVFLLAVQICALHKHPNSILTFIPDLGGIQRY